MDFAFSLKPSVNDYPWGKRKQTSLVYNLFKQHIDPENEVDSDRRYSELWVGTHPSEPSTLLPLRIRNITDNTFSNPEDPSSSSKNIEYLSDVLEKFYAEKYKITKRTLKILFKVLSIDKPLSLQVHPDVENAVKLFKKSHPSILDQSSKPEMFIALTKFSAIIGFRKIESILEYINKHSEFAEIVGEHLLNDMKHSLTSNSYTILGLTYVKLMKKILASTSLKLVSSLIKKLESETDKSLVEDFVLTLNRNFGYDICIIFPFIMNCITVDAGTAVFIPPNTVHSYIIGDCIEIMNNSDNVVRLGLTTKVTDPKLCIELVESNVSNEPMNLVHYVYPETISKFTLKYQPGHKSCNFIVWSVIIPPNEVDDIVLSNGFNTFLAIIIETNPFIVMNIAAEEGTITVDNTLAGDCFLFLPDTKLTIHNRGESKIVLYIASER